MHFSLTESECRREIGCLSAARLSDAAICASSLYNRVDSLWLVHILATNVPCVLDDQRPPSGCEGTRSTFVIFATSKANQESNRQSGGAISLNVQRLSVIAYLRSRALLKRSNRSETPTEAAASVR